MRVLFVTRKFPPSTGGMENMAYELSEALAADTELTLVKWGGTNKALPIVYPWLFLQAVWKGLSHRPDVVYLPDGLMAPLGWAIQLILRCPTIVTVHGLEVTYRNPLYRMLVLPFMRRQTALTTGSHEAKRRIMQEVPGTEPVVIFHGQRDVWYQPKKQDEQLALLARESGLSVEQLHTSKLLHTGGRLVRRKGVLWFVENVLPRLVAEQSIVYFVSGTGKDKELIEAAARERGIEDQVRMLGRVSDELLRALYNVADIFVMPNVPVTNDMEGFGLVALEAASCGTLVIASKLEGIQDAIQNGKNGLLVEPGNAAEYTKVISEALRKRSLSRRAIRNYTLEHYSWTEIARQYEALMQQLLLKP